MAVELVKLNQLTAMRQPGTVAVHPLRTVRSVDLHRMMRHVQPGQKSPHRQGKAHIVHRRVFHAGMQPAARIAKVFAQHVGLRVFLFDRLINAGQMPQVTGGTTVFPQHMHHVQPPTVDAVRWAQPMAHHATVATINRLGHLRFGKIEFRQAGVAFPVQCPAVRVEIEPTAVR
ncbi:hypothetical protein D3C79_427260 [compost metagenome]